MPDTPFRNSLTIAAAILALGLVLGGWLLGHNIAATRLADRSVTVRGLAERDVVADLATWTIAYSATGNEIAPVQAKIDRDTAALRAFLKRFGFADAEIAVAGVSVNQWVDANPAYGPDGRRNVTVRQRLQLRTPKVLNARRAAASVSELVRAGVAIEEGSNIVYSFTQLDRIKPAMIAAATRDARRGAEQFAKDSGARLGGIRSANQGVVTIEDRDRGSPHVKNVRVVTTVEYFLRD